MTAPFNGVAPNTAISTDAQSRFSGAVSWTETSTNTAVVGNFDGAKAYTATITLTPQGSYSFPAGTTFSVAGADSVTTAIGDSGLTATVTANYAIKDRYQIDDDGVITAYSGPGGELVVPGTIDGKTVIGIDKSVFFANMSLTNVTLPDTIQSLSENSFESCVNLQAINIPKYIRSIPASCFSSCSKLETVTIPPEASLQTIDECSFYDTKLKTMAIPATVTTIKNSAFRECRQLEAVTCTANSQLKTIGDNAFFYCALTEINLPATVTAIGEKAFIANKLTKVTLNNPNGTTLTIGKDAFSGSPQIPSQNPITEITLPAGVSLPVDPQAADATMGLYGASFKSFYESTEAGGNNRSGGTFVYNTTTNQWSKNP